MRYIYIVWKHEGETYAIAHDFGEDDWTAAEVANWMYIELDKPKYATFAFEEISKERYEWYARRKLTTANF